MKILVEIFDKKFKVNIKAITLDAAKYKIMGKIKFTEIKENDPAVDNLMNIFGMK